MKSKKSRWILVVASAMALMSASETLYGTT